MAKAKKRRKQKIAAFSKRQGSVGKPTSSAKDVQFGLQLKYIKKDLTKSLFLSFLAITLEFVIYWKMF